MGGRRILAFNMSEPMSLSGLIRIATVAFLALLALASSPARASDPAAGPAQAGAQGSVQAPYRVGTGDRLKIGVYNAEKLSGEFAVGGDGKIAYPILGRVPVSGLTLDEVAELVTMRLADGYLIEPRVTVDIISYRSVYILGEVARPGQYPYVEGLTIYQLVAQAGGFTYRANRKTIRLKHEGEPSERKYTIVTGSLVKPGDTVLILQRFF